jgi:prepilin-type processing-associated H-X9-DG protein
MSKRGMIVGLGLAFAVAASASIDPAAAQPNQPPPKPNPPPRSSNGLHNGQANVLYYDGHAKSAKPVHRPGFQSVQGPDRAAGAFKPVRRLEMIYRFDTRVAERPGRWSRLGVHRDYLVGRPARILGLVPTCPSTGIASPDGKLNARTMVSTAVACSLERHLRYLQRADLIMTARRHLACNSTGGVLS